MGRYNCIRWAAAVVVMAILVSGSLTVADEPAESVWAPKLYGLCVEMPANKNPSIAKHAELLSKLGFDGVGYQLWLDEQLRENLQTLDAAGLDVCLLYATVNVNPEKPPYDPRLTDAIKSLKGRSITVSVLLKGFPPGDPQGVEPAVKILRELGDLAAASGVRISVYHHLRDWTESFPFALEVVRKVDHPHVGVNFNLCHWLKIDGDRDYRPLLGSNADKLFAVTINGAQLGSDTWTDGLIQPLDRGNFDNRERLATLRNVGYRGPVGLMCFGIPDDTQEHLARSIEVWRSWQSHPAAE